MVPNFSSNTTRAFAIALLALLVDFGMGETRAWFTNVPSQTLDVLWSTSVGLMAIGVTKHLGRTLGVPEAAKKVFSKGE